MKESVSSFEDKPTQHWLPYVQINGKY